MVLPEAFWPLSMVFIKFRINSYKYAIAKSEGRYVWNNFNHVDNAVEYNVYHDISLDIS